MNCLRCGHPLDAGNFCPCYMNQNTPLPPQNPAPTYPSIPTYTPPPQMGWVCPLCNSVMSPTVPSCFHCKPQTPNIRGGIQDRIVGIDDLHYSDTLKHFIDIDKHTFCGVWEPDGSDKAPTKDAKKGDYFMVASGDVSWAFKSKPLETEDILWFNGLHWFHEKAKTNIHAKEKLSEQSK